MNMKKLFILLIPLLMAALVACSPGQIVSSESVTHRIEFAYIVGDEYMVSDTTALVDISNHVFVGEVESISFAIINDDTGKAPTAECNPSHLILITIYDVRVITAYKGADQATMRVITQGGIKGYREQEQLSVTMEAGARSLDGAYRVLIAPEISSLYVGESYLFAVQDLIVELDGYSNFVGVINSLQSLLNLDNPYYMVDDFSSISVESLISDFGTTAFAEHWAWWQSENPDWAQRLERSNMNYE